LPKSKLTAYAAVNFDFDREAAGPRGEGLTFDTPPCPGRAESRV